MEANLFVPIIVAIVSGVVTGWAGSWFYSYRTKAELKKEFLSSFIERKWDTYEDFSNVIKNMMMDTKNGALDQNLDDHIQDLLDFTGDLWIRGSDDVVKAVADWKRMGQRIEENPEIQEEDPLSIIESLIEIIISMRKDLGYDSEKVDKKDLMQTFINDVDQFYD